jgi:hypothetical protein
LKFVQIKNTNPSLNCIFQNLVSIGSQPFKGKKREIPREMGSQMDAIKLPTSPRKMWLKASKAQLWQRRKACGSEKAAREVSRLGTWPETFESGKNKGAPPSETPYKLSTQAIFYTQL